MTTANVTQTGGAATVAVTVSRGLTGATGAAGPNTVTTSTTTNINGIIKGNGSVVSLAVAGTDYAAALGANDNYVTDAQLVVIGNTSGTNTGDQFTSVTSHRLIGRHAGGSGAAQEVQVDDGLEFQGSGIRRSALTGDITASAGSNATTLASTIAGNKTFSGDMAFTSTTRPTSAGTGTPAATSLITLTDQANEFLRKVNKYSEHEIYTFTTAMLTTMGGTAAPISTTGGADTPAWSFRPTNTVASANNYQALLGPYLQLSNGSNRSTKNWSKRSSLSLRTYNPSASAGTVRYYWGPQSSTWAGGALAVRGIGFEIVNNSVFATCHNGTTKTTSASGVALTTQIFVALHIESDGAGGVRWWVDNVEQTAITGGPTGNSGVNQFGFCTEAVNPDPAAGTFVNIHYLRLATVN